MRIKKTAMAIIMFSAIVTFVGVKFAGAQVYTPLVNIPGLPPDTAVNLSMYLVGLYDFLLSVVGIVAVMMLVIGGMRYITAAGNQASVSEAKDIITNALAGLLLAILSWVIVAEINPDVLYIKKPGGAFVDTPSWDLGSCGTFDLAAFAATPAACCTCVGPVPPGPPAVIGNLQGVFDQNTCDFVCKALKYCNLPDPKSCIATGTPPKITTDMHSEFMLPPYEGKCHCVDDEFVEPDLTAVPPPTTCQEVCSNPLQADDGLYHGIKIALGVFKLDDDGEAVPISRVNEDTFTLKVDRKYLFDFSDSYDCKGEIVSFAIHFSGNPGILTGGAPDRWCCMTGSAGCPLLGFAGGSWAGCCNLLGCPPFKPPMCNDENCGILGFLQEKCTYFKPNADNSNYPIYQKSYNALELLLSSKKEVWVGVSNKITAGECYSDAEKFFSVTIEN